MTTIPLIRVTVLRPLLRTLMRLGAPIDRYLDEVGLSPSVLESPERFVPMRQCGRLLRAAARGEGIPDLALTAGEQARIEDLGTFGESLLRARTLRQALARLVECTRAFNSGESWRLETRDDLTLLCHAFVEDLLGDYDDVEQFSVAVVVNLLRRAAGAAWTPREVHWRRAPSASVLGSPLFRGTRHLASQPATAIGIPSAVLERPMPVVHVAAGTGDVDAWREDLPPTDFVSSMREVIELVAPRDGHPRIDLAATALGVSVRTLQRRLSDHGVSFDQLVKTMRLGMATDLLANTDAKIIGIALDLGYSDHAHFTRAFHKWTGVSPIEYRRRHRAQTVA